MSIMSIKKFLKKFSLFNYINMQLKSFLQDNKITLERSIYNRRMTSKGLKVLEDKDLIQALQKRLALRGVEPIPKSIKDLHIFLAIPINNWESVLPLALSTFGRLSIFKWRGKDLYDSRDEWLKQRNILNTEMLKCFTKANKKKSVDIVVGYFSDFNTKPETLIEMANKKAVIFNFSWDDKLYFTGKLKGQPRGLFELAPFIDLNLTSAPDSRVKYIVRGGLSLFWPEAGYPDIHRPYKIPFEFDVSFIGKKYGRRIAFIKKLRKLGIKITAFGNGWGNGPLSDKDVIKLYSKSRINLGFANIGYSKRSMCLKLRDFEVPMSGNLYLTQDNPELALVYDVDKEIVTYKDENDCAKKVKWLLNNPEQAEKIRKAGRKRALKDHTWEKRFVDIFQKAGVLKK